MRVPFLSALLMAAIFELGTVSPTDRDQMVMQTTELLQHPPLYIRLFVWGMSLIVGLIFQFIPVSDRAVFLSKFAKLHPMASRYVRLIRSVAIAQFAELPQTRANLGLTPISDFYESQRKRRHAEL